MANCEMLMHKFRDSGESISCRFSNVVVSYFNVISLNLDLGMASKYLVTERDYALGLKSVLPPQEASY